MPTAPPAYELPSPPPYQEGPPPTYEEATKIYDNCASCMNQFELSEMMLLSCSHTFCKTCTNNLSRCPECFDGETRAPAITNYLPLAAAKIKASPCCHNFNLLEFISAGDGHCLTCQGVVEAFTIISEGKTMTEDEKALQLHQDGLSKSVINLFTDLACEVVDRTNKKGIFNRIVNKLMLKSHLIQSSNRINYMSTCCLCTKDVSDKVETDCCGEVLCKMCVRVMARVTKDVRQRCPCCKTTKFLTAEGRYWMRSVTKTFYDEIERDVSL